MITFFHYESKSTQMDMLRIMAKVPLTPLMVKSKDIEKYVARLKSDQTVFKAIGTSDGKSLHNQVWKQSRR